MKPGPTRAALAAETKLACPLCAVFMHHVESGPAGERRRCSRCGLVAVFPRVSLVDAIRRRP
jgi:hypothetical protein